MSRIQRILRQGILRISMALKQAGSAFVAGLKMKMLKILPFVFIFMWAAELDREQAAKRFGRMLAGGLMRLSRRTGTAGRMYTPMPLTTTAEREMLRLGTGKCSFPGLAEPACGTMFTGWMKIVNFTGRRTTGTRDGKKSFSMTRLSCFMKATATI